MNVFRPITITELLGLIGMFQYYREIWNRMSHVLDALTEAASDPKGRKYIGITIPSWPSNSSSVWSLMRL